jgi:anti-sigma regulatory factor (Ser/Thr protein kinase)
MDRVDEFGFTAEVPADAIAKIQLVLDEIIMNVLTHAEADDVRNIMTTTSYIYANGRNVMRMTSEVSL